MRIFQPIGKVSESKGFTLVELLVVISIISLLMSIMMPSLRSSREQACRLDCSSNLRNLTLAWQMYAYDNDDKLCHPGTYWNETVYDFYWVSDGPRIPYNDQGNTDQALKDGVLWPYLKNLEIYKCKQDRSDRKRSFSLSGTMGPANLSGTQETGSIESGTKQQFKPFITLNQIERPSSKMVFIGVQCSNRWLNGEFHSFMDMEEHWASFVSVKSVRTARHNGGCNVSFSDTHVEYWRWNDFDYDFLTRDAEDVERLYNALKGIRVGYFPSQGRF